MEKYKLSEVYFLATRRIIDDCVEMYESMHDNDGNPVINSEDIYESILRFRKTLSIEVDLIKQALTSFNEES